MARTEPWTSAVIGQCTIFTSLLFMYVCVMQDLVINNQQIYGKIIRGNRDVVHQKNVKNTMDI